MGLFYREGPSQQPLAQLIPCSVTLTEPPTAVPRSCRDRVSSAFAMAGTIITASGDHAADPDTRLADMGADVTYDVNESSWLYTALSLEQYADADASEGWGASAGARV